MRRLAGIIVALGGLAASACYAGEECGDGHEDIESEECDDGNQTGGDGCSAFCLVEMFCGDGFLDVGEACDDGNTANGDACHSDCTLPACNDDIVDPGEECDGNNVPDDCASLGMGVGAVTCDSMCLYDTSACGAPVCADATPITCGVNNSNATASMAFDATFYMDCPTPVTADVSGPEIVYDRVQTVAGQSSLLLSGVPNGTLAVFSYEIDGGGTCNVACVAVGLETSPGTFNLTFTAVAGVHYIAVGDTPAGGSVLGHQLYWTCPQ